MPFSPSSRLTLVSPLFSSNHIRRSAAPASSTTSARSASGPTAPPPPASVRACASTCVRPSAHRTLTLAIRHNLVVITSLPPSNIPNTNKTKTNVAGVAILKRDWAGAIELVLRSRAGEDQRCQDVRTISYIQCHRQSRFIIFQFTYVIFYMLNSKTGPGVLGGHEGRARGAGAHAAAHEHRAGGAAGAGQAGRAGALYV